MIQDYLHPQYGKKVTSWEKWRYVVGSSEEFINRYLKLYSNRETIDDYNARRLMSPNPAYAKSCLIEIRNSIYGCLRDIKRIGGPQGYQYAMQQDVDMSEASMNYFIGVHVLYELLAMAKVGVYVDRPAIDIVTKADAVKARPYIYMYKAEQIRSWTYEGKVLTSVLLEDMAPKIDEKTGLTIGEEKRYRHIYLDDGVVAVDTYDSSKLIDSKTLTIGVIPFAIAEISDSLLEDTADYQIALLNIESSDINYVIRSNFPFYTEQYAPTAKHFTDTGDDDAQGDENIKVGAASGRRYAKGMERPGFIHPSSEPILASMQKSDSLKQTMRHLMQLTIASLKPVRESAESKQQDNRGLSAGLSYIGMELQRLENQIAEIWAAYDNVEPAYVVYPEIYDIRSPEERLSEADKYTKIIDVPSLSYKKHICKKIIRALCENDAPNDLLISMLDEIDSAPAICLSSEDLRQDTTLGLVDQETASKIRTYPAGSVEKAKAEQVERLAKIAIAQTEGAAAARGVGDNDTAKLDKQTPDSPDGRKPQRGKA